METPHSHENGLHSIPDTEHVREKEPRLKKPDNFFQYFHERLAAIDLDKFSSLQTAYSRWIMYEFTESAGDGLRDFSEKNKDHKDVYSKNLFSFIGYGLVSEISKEAYGILDNIGASDAHPDLDAQILLIADRILEEPHGGNHLNHAAAADILKQSILESFKTLLNTDPDIRIENRIAKFEKMGKWDNG